MVGEEPIWVTAQETKTDLKNLKKALMKPSSFNSAFRVEQWHHACLHIV